jgi:hypothetical protein
VLGGRTLAIPWVAGNVSAGSKLLGNCPDYRRFDGVSIGGSFASGSSLVTRSVIGDFEGRSFSLGEGFLFFVLERIGESSGEGAAHARSSLTLRGEGDFRGCGAVAGNLTRRFQARGESSGDSRFNGIAYASAVGSCRAASMAAATSRRNFTRMAVSPRGPVASANPGRATHASPLRGRMGSFEKPRDTFVARRGDSAFARPERGEFRSGDERRSSRARIRRHESFAVRRNPDG